MCDSWPGWFTLRSTQPCFLRNSKGKTDTRQHHILPLPVTTCLDDVMMQPPAAVCLAFILLSLSCLLLSQSVSLHPATFWHPLCLFVMSFLQSHLSLCYCYRLVLLQPSRQCETQQRFWCFIFTKCNIWNATDHFSFCQSCHQRDWDIFTFTFQFIRSLENRNHGAICESSSF